MVEIKKQSPPPGLVALQQKAIRKGLSAAAAYKTLHNPLKSCVGKSLMSEQGYLCAYCMRKIPDTRSVPPTPEVIIEHWIARHDVTGAATGQGLEYNNLFAVCSGNRAESGNRTKDDLTCDAARGNDAITVNPIQPATLASIFYHSDGRIDAYDSVIRDDIIHKLNLNCVSANLIAARKAALDALKLKVVRIDSKDRLDFCKAQLSLYQHSTGAKVPYVGILIWWLQDYISKHSE